MPTVLCVDDSNYCNIHRAMITTILTETFQQN